MTPTSHSGTESDRWLQFYDMMAEDGHDDTSAVRFGLGRVFRGIDFQEKAVLEIGSGRGLMSMYSSLRGASSIVSMEPELAGARSNVLEVHEKRLKTLGLTNVKLISDDFNTWNAGEYKCDIAMMFATINHLHESPFNARFHSETFENYRCCCEKLRSVLNPGGVAVVTDACRYGLFTWLKYAGIRRPWRRRRSSLNWRIHQNPRTWKKILLASGFSRVDMFYPLPYRLRHLGPLVSNGISNFFLHANFVAHCHA